jgi:hypothetical protein
MITFCITIRKGPIINLKNTKNDDIHVNEQRTAVKQTLIKAVKNSEDQFMI